MKVVKGNSGRTRIVCRSDQNLIAAETTTGGASAMVLPRRLCFTAFQEETRIGPLPAASLPVLAPGEQP